MMSMLVVLYGGGLRQGGECAESVRRTWGERQPCHTARMMKGGCDGVCGTVHAVGFDTCAAVVRRIVEDNPLFE